MGRRVHHPWPRQDQDQEETGDKSHQEDDVWRRNTCQSKACQDGRQGIPNSCAEGRYLILDFARQVSRVIAWVVPLRDSPCPACWPGEGAATTTTTTTTTKTITTTT